MNPCSFVKVVCVSTPLSTIAIGRTTCFVRTLQLLPQAQLLLLRAPRLPQALQQGRALRHLQPPAVHLHLPTHRSFVKGRWVWHQLRLTWWAIRIVVDISIVSMGMSKCNCVQMASVSTPTFWYVIGRLMWPAPIRAQRLLGCQQLPRPLLQAPPQQLQAARLPQWLRQRSQPQLDPRLSLSVKIIKMSCWFMLISLSWDLQHEYDLLHTDINIHSTRTHYYQHLLTVFSLFSASFILIPSLLQTFDLHCRPQVSSTTGGTSGKIFVAYFANWFQWWPEPYKFLRLADDVFFFTV